MGLRCGIVGLPNVGKSTLFNALTGGNAPAANYPFCTIEENVGSAPLIDSRLERIAECCHAAKIVPASVQFVDIAGLVKGASQGAGLGNRFLSHVREVEGIAHVVRCFEEADVTHVDGAIDPARDVDTINLELMLADMATLERVINRAAAKQRSGDKDAAAVIAVCKKVLDALGNEKPARWLALSAEESAQIAPLCLLTMKPVIYVANVAEDGFANNPLLDTVRRIAGDEPVVPICAQMERDIADFTDEEKAEWLQLAASTDSTGLCRLAQAAFTLLNRITYFTAGPKEARAWVIKHGMNAQQAAACIHNDFARGFICAEVVDWQCFLANGSMARARETGQLRQEGKHYQVADGDVIEFRFNV